jgi:flagellar hook assembly protein FlgD
MALHVPSPTAVGRTPRGTGGLLSAWPNPSSGSVRLALREQTEGTRDIVIVSAGGRQIRRERIAAGAGSWLWDGRDQDGRELGPGAYFARIAGAGADQGGMALIRAR